MTKYKKQLIIVYIRVSVVQNNSILIIGKREGPSLSTDSSNHISIRNATRDDSALILSFVKGLAGYVKMEDDVTSTAEMIEDWLFNKNAAEAIFASLDGKEVGFALYYQTFSTFLGKAGLYLEDLYVIADYRGRGVGTALLRK